MRRIKEVFLFFGFLVGLFSLTLFFFYLLAGVFYTFSNAEYVGDIAYLPKWIFLFSPLAFLAKTKSVSEIIERL